MRTRHDFPGTFDVRLVSVFTRKCSKRVLLDEAVEAVVPVFGRFLSICLRLFSHTVVSVKVWAWKRLSWLSRSEFLAARLEDILPLGDEGGLGGARDVRGPPPGGRAHPSDAFDAGAKRPSFAEVVEKKGRQL